MPTISTKNCILTFGIAVSVLFVVLMTFDSPGIDGLLYFRPSQEWLTASKAVSAQAEKTCWHPLGVGVNIDLTPSNCTGSFLRRVLGCLTLVAFAVMIVVASIPDKTKRKRKTQPHSQ